MLQITDKGIKIDDFDEIYLRLANSFKEIYGHDVNLESDTPDGQLLGLFTQELSNIHKAVTFIIQMLDPYQAEGSFLEQRAMYAGILRNTASYSYIDDVIVTGVPTTNIPYETIMVDRNKDRWIVTERAVLNDLGSARVKLRSIELGNFKVKQLDDLTLSTIIVGVDNIIANSASYGGADEESDVDLLKRFMLSHSINNHDDKIGIQAALFNITGVKKCIVYENYTNVTDDKGVPPHSMNAVLLGGEDKAIAKVITQKKIGGCGLQGKIEVNHLHAGDIRVAKFDRPARLPIDVHIIISRYQSFKDIDIESIQTNLKKSNFNIGENVYASRIISSINLTEGFYIKELTVNGSNIVNVGHREYAEITDVEVLIDD